MRKSSKEKYREQGRRELWKLLIEKFEDIHDHYYAQGNEGACDLVTNMVAWLQDDLEGVSEES